MFRIGSSSALGWSLMLLSLGIACGGSVTPTAPSPTASPAPSPSPSPSPTAAPPPSQDFQTLELGMWIGRVAFVFVDRTTGFRYDPLTGCALAAAINTQDGGEFSGGLDAQGSGAGSDWQCATFQAAFTGVMTPDGTVTSLRFQPQPHLGGCTHVEGGDTYTGVVSNNGTQLTATLSDRWVCQLDRQSPRTFDGDMTTTISMQKR